MNTYKLHINSNPKSLKAYMKIHLIMNVEIYVTCLIERMHKNFDFISDEIKQFFSQIYRKINEKFTTISELFKSLLATRNEKRKNLYYLEVRPLSMSGIPIRPLSISGMPMRPLSMSEIVILESKLPKAVPKKINKAAKIFIMDCFVM